MSNNFRSVKSVAEQLSDLTVTNDVTVRQRLYVKDLIATRVFNLPDGKTIQSKTFTFDAPHTTANVITGASLDATKDATIVAAEITHDGTVSVDIGTGTGTTADATSIFAAVPSGTRRVSSAFSQTLGSSGSPVTATLTAGDELVAKASSGTSSVNDVELTVHYYLD